MRSSCSRVLDIRCFYLLRKDAFDGLAFRVGVSLAISAVTLRRLAFRGRVGPRFLRVATHAIAKDEVATQFPTDRWKEIQVVPRLVRRRLKGFVASYR